MAHVNHSYAQGRAPHIFDLLEAWKRGQLSGMAASTRTNYYSNVRNFIWWGNISSPHQIKHGLIEDYLGYRTQNGAAAASTVRSIHAAITKFCDHLLFKEIIPANPCNYVSLPKIIVDTPVFLTEEEMRHALRLGFCLGCGFEVKFALATGFRLDEMRRFARKNINLDAGFLKVKGKGDKIRTVPIQKQLRGDLEIMLSYKPDGPLFPGKNNEPRSTQTWYKLLLPLRELMPKISGWHIFRHTFASLLAQRDVELAKIRNWLGHRNIQTTLDYYVTLSPSNHDDDINKMPSFET